MSEKNKGLIPEDLDPREAMVRTSIVMEGDLLLNLKQWAGQAGLPYQTLMKMLLRQAIAERQNIKLLGKLPAENRRERHTKNKGRATLFKAKTAKKGKRA